MLKMFKIYVVKAINIGEHVHIVVAEDEKEALDIVMKAYDPELETRVEVLKVVNLDSPKEVYHCMWCREIHEDFCDCEQYIAL